MKFLIEANAQADIKLAIDWLAKKVTLERAKSIVISTIQEVKQQLITHPDSGTRCEFDFNGKYREIIKNNYRTIYKIDKTHNTVTIILFCHTRMNFQTLLSQSSIFKQEHS